MKALFNLSIAPGLVEFSAESVRFNPVKLDKHNRPSYLMQPLKVRRFEDRALDPVRHLEIYVRRTKGLRTSNSLFVITRKPYSAVARGTLARWLTEVISASGQKGTGRSVRSVGSSKAMAREIPLDSILEAGDWSRQNTFLRFYYKMEKTYDRVILEENAQH